MIGFYKSYFLLALLLLAAEIFIGCYMHDAIIRPFGGDFLVVILLGTTFSFIDLLCYTLGILLVLIVENFKASLSKF